LSNFKPRWDIFTSILAFGSSQFLLQLALSGVQWLINASTGWYGVRSLGIANGADVAVSGMNIAGTLNMLILMPVFGLNQGAQPVLGFNYGAKKFDRVRKAFLLTVRNATIICTAGFLGAELFPGFIVRLFVADSSNALMTWTTFALRAGAAMMFLNGFQIVSTNMFVVTGRPKMSILLSMMRQVIVLIPAILILGRLFGIYGVSIAMPVADFTTFCVTLVLIIREIKRLKAQEQAQLRTTV
jgi:Na+-driven multidrug efflux pump